MKETSSDRAARRASWPISIHRQGSEPGEDLSATTTAEERLAMVWELSVRAWALSGREWPEYERNTMPGRVIRPDR
jgi:hypothetical protein